MRKKSEYAETQPALTKTGPAVSGLEQAYRFFTAPKINNKTAKIHKGQKKKPAMTKITPNGTAQPMSCPYHGLLACWMSLPQCLQTIASSCRSVSAQ